MSVFLGSVSLAEPQMFLGFILVVWDVWVLKEIKMLTYENKMDGLYLTSMEKNFCNSFEVPISADH